MKSIFLAALLCPLAAPALAADTLSFSVVSVDGGILKLGTKAITPGAVLKPEETLSLTGGKAVLSLGKAGKIMIKGASQFTPRRAKGESSLSLLKGALLAALPGLKGRKFHVRTAQAVAAVRGTEFYIETGKDETYLCVCEGAVDALGSGPKPVSLNVDKKHRHQARTLRPGPEGTLLDEKAGMRGHDDAELESLRAP